MAHHCARSLSRTSLGSGSVTTPPELVVGQLQRKMERHDFLTRLKVKIRHCLLPVAVSDGWGNPAPVAL
jgi:HTH-type transcriptional regulator / antitoxin HigA